MIKLEKGDIIYIKERKSKTWSSRGGGKCPNKPFGFSDYRSWVETPCKGKIVDIIEEEISTVNVEVEGIIYGFEKKSLIESLDIITFRKKKLKLLNKFKKL